MPDIFIPIDTNKYSTFYNDLVRRGIVSSFVMSYLSDYRAELKSRYPTFADYHQNFKISKNLYDDLIEYARKEGVTDTAMFNFSSRLEAFAKSKRAELDSLYPSVNDLQKLDKFEKMMSDYVKDSYKTSVKDRNSQLAPSLIKNYLLFEIARNLYSYGEAYRIILEDDDCYKQACKVMKDNRVFRRFKVHDN